MTQVTETENNKYHLDTKAHEFEVDGIKCVITRNRRTNYGNLCGFAGVTKAHPLFGHGYQGLDLGVQVHKGVDFSGTIGETGINANPILPQDRDFAAYGDLSPDAFAFPKTDALWWFGFHTAHSGDKLPGNPEARENDTYKGFDYVKNQLESLAHGLKKYGDSHQVAADSLHPNANKPDTSKAEPEAIKANMAKATPANRHETAPDAKHAHDFRDTKETDKGHRK